MPKERRGGKVVYVKKSEAGGAKRLISDRMYDNEMELKYASDMAHKFGNVKYGGTTKTAELFREWNDEVRRLQRERNELDKELSSYKTIKDAPDFIKSQVGLDINKFHNDAAKQFEKRGSITIDISDMKQAERTKLANALRQKYSPYTGEQSGTWLFTIKKKKKEVVPF